MRGVIDVMDVIGIFRPKSRIWESSTWRRICRYLLPCYDLGKMMGELYFDFAMQGTFMSDYAFYGGYVPLKKNKKHWSGVNVPPMLQMQCKRFICYSSAPSTVPLPMTKLMPN